ncbi:putative movement protein 2 [Elderberry latent virus]|uniref:Movement protein 2 n=1 Tax=Elderberry latent virus TaxID=167018 RepID=A0A0B4MJW8_9TOMB|nr:putative movement protein 2 [Elderberry latent virus]AHZ59465.1 putative movement protein 2 [Elderberry latent virus]
MASAREHILTLLVLCLSLLLIKSHFTLPSISRPSFDSPNLLVSIVLGLFFASVLTPGNYVYSYYSANSTSDKYISVAVGNGQ